MTKSFDKKVIDFTNKSMEEISNELDLVYCKENTISFSNDEVDMMSINLFDKESTDTAYELLHPKKDAL